MNCEKLLKDKKIEKVQKIRTFVQKIRTEEKEVKKQKTNSFRYINCRLVFI